MKRTVSFLCFFCLLLLAASTFAGCGESSVKSKLTAHTWVNQETGFTFYFSDNGNFIADDYTGSWTLGDDNTLTLHIEDKKIPDSDISLPFYNLTDEEMELGRKLDAKGWCVSDKHLTLCLYKGTTRTFIPKE